jgi:hypothetical protein
MSSACASPQRPDRLRVRVNLRRSSRRHGALALALVLALATTAGCSYRRTDSSNGLFIPDPTTSVVGGAARVAIPADGSVGDAGVGTGPMVQIAAARSVLHREASTDADVVTLLLRGESVRTTGGTTLDGAWISVVSERGSGWVLVADLVAPPSAD